MKPQDFVKVSIHATLAGGDKYTAPSAPIGLSFYPRHPRGWRRKRWQWAGTCCCVSIHATLAGGDLPKTAWSTAWPTFLSTPPSRVATMVGAPSALNQVTFLSTPPSRVATKRWTCAKAQPCCFYPRHPRGWRRWQYSRRRYRFHVSIHATLAGGDSEAADFIAWTIESFYPRHPRGWRPGISSGWVCNSMFLSTPPSRVATGRCAGRLMARRCFYPRHPRGWRPAQPP